MHTFRTNPARPSANRGFTLLFAVLISGLLLAISLAIFNITVKEVTISSAGRESHFAFYAADSGAECALYWDVARRSFSTTTPTRQIECNGQIFTVGGGSVSTFTVYFNPGPTCARVTVTKDSANDQTTIESRGYNTCDAGNPRRAERALRIMY